jgi:hypothetical protein
MSERKTVSDLIDDAMSGVGTMNAAFAALSDEIAQAVFSENPHLRAFGERMAAATAARNKPQ